MDSADVLVIGAGIAGLSAAWSFAQHGAQTVVIDPFPGMGCGASGAASGVLLPPLGRRRTTTWGRVQHAAWDRWDEWRRVLEHAAGMDIGWNPCGVLRFVDWMPRIMGPDCQWHADGRVVEPTLDAIPPPYGAIAAARGGHIQPLATLAALRTALRTAGGRIVTDRVQRLAWRTRQPPCAAAWTDARSPIAAGLIVVAAGAQTPSLLASLGWHPALVRDAGAIVQLRRTPLPSRVVCRGRITVAAKPDGSVVVTGAHWGDVEPCMTMERLVDLWEGAAQTLGAAGVVAAAWTGVRLYGAHGLPVIGRIADSNVAVVTGLGRQGYLLAPLIGDLLERHTLDRTQFDPAPHQSERAPL